MAAQGQHPFARCLLAMHRKQWHEAAAALSRWDPESPSDSALKLQYEARLAAGGGDLNAAVALAVKAASIEGATEVERSMCVGAPA